MVKGRDLLRMNGIAGSGGPMPGETREARRREFELIGSRNPIAAAEYARTHGLPEEMRRMAYSEYLHLMTKAQKTNDIRYFMEAFRVASRFSLGMGEMLRPVEAIESNRDGAETLISEKIIESIGGCYGGKRPANAYGGED